MEGRIVTNEKTGEQAWWDGTKLTPVRIEQGANVAPQDIAAGVAGQTAPLRPDEVKKLPPPPTAPNPANPPRFPMVERMARTTAIPVATALAGLATGGASLPVQAAVGAGGEALSQLAEGGPMNPASIGLSAAMPAVGRGLGEASKLFSRTAAKLTGRGGLVEAGAQKLEGSLGFDKAAANALQEGAKASEIAVPGAMLQRTKRAIADNVEKYSRIGGADNLVKEATDIVNTAHAAVKSGQPWTYGEWFERAKILNETAQKTKLSNTEAAGLRDIRAAILDDLSRIDPMAREAVTAYRRQAGIEDLSKALTKGNPLKEVDALLKDKLVGGILSKAEKETARTIANHVGPEGLGKTALALGGIAGLGWMAGGAAGAGYGSASASIPILLGALVTSPHGGAIARAMVGPSGKINQVTLPALAQLVRGYMAEQATPKE